MSFDLKIKGGDIAIAPNGSLELVSDNAKLRQDIIKILLTKLGENKYHPQYGSQLGAIQIGHVPDPDLLESDLRSSVESALNKIITLQKSQSRKQYLTPGEVLISILDVSVSHDEIDPRLYNVFISVQTGKLTTLTESITVRIL